MAIVDPAGRAAATGGPEPLGAERRGLAGILLGVALVSEIAAFAYLAVAARGVLTAEGEGRLTPAPVGRD